MKAEYLPPLQGFGHGGGASPPGLTPWANSNVPAGLKIQNHKLDVKFKTKIGVADLSPERAIALAQGMSPGLGHCPIMTGVLKGRQKSAPEINGTNDCLVLAESETCMFDDVAGTFIARFGRTTATGQGIDLAAARQSSLKSSLKIIELMRQSPGITIAEMALAVGITERGIKKQIEKLKDQGKIRRVGPDKGGHWEVPPTR